MIRWRKSRGLSEKIHGRYNGEVVRDLTTKHEEVYEMNTVDYRRVLRLEALGYSRARIATSVHSSHRIVKAVLDTATKKGCMAGGKKGK